MSENIISKTESKYKFNLVNSTEFHIYNPHCNPIEVTYDGQYFRINETSCRYSSLNRHALINEITRKIFSAFIKKQDEEEEQNTTDLKKKKPGGRTWIKNIIGKSISKRISAHCNELIKNTDPTRLLLEKRYFSTFGSAVDDVEKLEKWMKEKYWLQDALRFIAPLYAFKHKRPYSFDDDDYAQECKDPNKWYEMFLGKKSNSEKNKTLYELPRGIPPHLLIEDFIKTNIPRQLKSKLELISVLSSSTRDRNLEIIKFAEKEELRKGYKIVNQPHRNYREIRAAIRYVLDYPEVANCDFIGLCRRSRLYHEELYTGRGKKSVSIPLDTLTKLPPIALPKNKYITFLKNAGEIEKEANDMHHCVHGYVKDAVEGRCFLFHCDYKKKKATIEVGSRGIVVQSRGPCNETNIATKYAENKLNEWGKLFNVDTTLSSNKIVLANVDEDILVPF